MLNVEHLEHEVDDLLLEILSRESGWTLSGDLCLERKIECLSDGEGGVVVLVLLAVDRLSSVSLLEEVCVEGTVQDVSVYLCVSVSLVADDLEERGTAASWLS